MKIKISKKEILAGIIIYILLASCYLLNPMVLNMGTRMDWLNFATFIAGIVSPITTIGTIYIAYLVYKLNDDSHKSEKYFENIVSLFIKIQEIYSGLEYSLLLQNDKEIKDKCAKIKTNVRLLRYYLHRFPDTSHPVKEFDSILNHIWFEPFNKEWYKSLDSEFENFCNYANQGQKRPIKKIKDKKGKLVDITY